MLFACRKSLRCLFCGDFDDKAESCKPVRLVLDAVDSYQLLISVKFVDRAGLWMVTQSIIINFLVLSVDKCDPKSAIVVLLRLNFPDWSPRIKLNQLLSLMVHTFFAKDR